MRYFVYIVIIASIFYNGIALGKDIKKNDSELVGTVTGAEKSWYAIVKMASGRKKLYTKGDIFCSEADGTDCLRIEEIAETTLILKDVDSEKNYTLGPGDRIPLKGADVIFEKALDARVIEYRYNDSRDHRRGSDDFIFKNLNGEGVVLERSLDKRELLAGLSKEEKDMFDSPEAKGVDAERISADFFENIKIKKIDEDTWSISRESAKGALSNTGKSLISVIKRTRPSFRFGEGPSLKFNCELGDVVLNRDGFLVHNLAVAKLAERAGIKKGDLIKRVNGRPVNSLYGIFRTYMDLKSNSGIEMVKLDIVRNGKLETLVYNIK